MISLPQFAKIVCRLFSHRPGKPQGDYSIWHDYVIALVQADLTRKQHCRFDVVPEKRLNKKHFATPHCRNFSSDRQTVKGQCPLIPIQCRLPEGSGHRGIKDIQTGQRRILSIFRPQLNAGGHWEREKSKLYEALKDLATPASHRQMKGSQPRLCHVSIPSRVTSLTDDLCGK